jgi:hypothetical protein
MRTVPHLARLGLLIAVALVPIVQAETATSADQSIKQFLAKDDRQLPYRAMRRLEAQNRSRRGWLEAITEYSPQTGFHYEVTAEGGSRYIRNKVLRAVLDGEREVFARGESARASIAHANYTFQANGVGSDGLVNVLLAPRRQERVLVAGTMFLRPDDGALVRLRGRLAKSPSFWIKNVEIVRSYERIHGAVMPVSLESTAQVRMLGPSTLRMTYDYSEIDGQPVATARSGARQP